MPIDLSQITNQLIQLGQQNRQRETARLQQEKLTMSLQQQAQQLADRKLVNSTLSANYDESSGTIDMQQTSKMLMGHDRPDLAQSIQKQDVDMRKDLAMMSDVKRRNIEGELKAVSGQLQGLRTITDPVRQSQEYTTRVASLKAKGYGKELSDEFPGPEIIDDYLLRAAGANTVFNSLKSKSAPKQSEWQFLADIAAIPEEDRSQAQQRQYDTLINKRDIHGKIPSTQQVTLTSNTIDSIAPHLADNRITNMENRGAYDAAVAGEINKIQAASTTPISYATALTQAMSVINTSLVNEQDLKGAGLLDASLKWIEEKTDISTEDARNWLKGDNYVYIPGLTKTAVVEHEEEKKTIGDSLPRGLTNQDIKHYIDTVYDGVDTRENRLDIIKQFKLQTGTK
jgi:hypothetical protein